MVERGPLGHSPSSTFLARAVDNAAAAQQRQPPPRKDDAGRKRRGVDGQPPFERLAWLLALQPERATDEVAGRPPRSILDPDDVEPARPITPAGAHQIALRHRDHLALLEPGQLIEGAAAGGG